MKKLLDYKAEIHKCSKCGLCQSVCPIYEQTGNDCAVSRGKFIMLNGVVKGDLELNPNIDKYLDMCLKCNACKNFCPSGIDAREIFLAAKADFFESNSAPSMLKSFIKIFHSNFVFHSFLSGLKFSLSLYRRFQLDKIVTKFYSFFSRLGNVGKRIILANEFVKSHNQSKINSQISEKKIKVVYFKGCVNEFLNPSEQEALKPVLEALGCEIIEPEFKCCGVPFLSSGNREQFIKQAEYNLGQVPDDFDFFLTDCASCAGAFADYKKVLSSHKVQVKINQVLAKSINSADFINSQVEKISFKSVQRVTFHKPCHLKDDEFLKDLFKKFENVEYVEMKDFDKCCGFAGEFAIKNQLLSQKISSQKAQNALDTNADFILTTCPSCELGIMQGLIDLGAFDKCSRVINLSEFISMADSIEQILPHTEEKQEDNSFSHLFI